MAEILYTLVVLSVAFYTLKQGPKWDITGWTGLSPAALLLLCVGIAVFGAPDFYEHFSTPMGEE